MEEFEGYMFITNPNVRNFLFLRDQLKLLTISVADMFDERNVLESNFVGDNN
jgi:hypothetical protein